MMALDSARALRGPRRSWSPATRRDTRRRCTGCSGIRAPSASGPSRWRPNRRRALRRRTRPLVRHVHPLQVAVRLLEGEQEAGRARLLDPVGDPLEVDQQVVLDADRSSRSASAPCASSGSRPGSSPDSGPDRSRPRHLGSPSSRTPRGAHRSEVVVEGRPLAARIARGREGDADAVGVRVTRQDTGPRLRLRASWMAASSVFGILGIGDMARARSGSRRRACSATRGRASL